MNKGLYSGFGSHARGILQPCVWQVFETTVARQPFMANAKFMSFIIIGAGGGGGGGRFGLSTAASGGGGGASGGTYIGLRIPVDLLRNYGMNSFSATIGAGGTSGAGATVDGNNGGNGGTGGSSELRYFNIPIFGGGTAASTISSIPQTATGGAGGTGGTTTTGTAGAQSTTLPYGGFPQVSGGAGSTTIGALSYQQALFPNNCSPLGGNGGSGKGNASSYVMSFGPAIGNGGSQSFSDYGNHGVDAQIFGTRGYDLLCSLPRFPDALEIRNYLSGGGGAGQGGNTTTNAAGGNGGNGWRGSGGGGGGGASGTNGGNGGVGGNGIVIICWEFE